MPCQAHLEQCAPHVLAAIYTQRESRIGFLTGLKAI